MLDTLLHFDIHLFCVINSHNTPFLDWFFWFITHLGSGWIIGPATIGIILVKSPRAAWRNTIICGVIAISVSGLINSQIKIVTQRPRPITHFERYPYAPHRTGVAPDEIPPTEQFDSLVVHVVGEELRYLSFPSGHTNTAFAVATLLVFLYGGWFYVMYILAVLVAYSRVYIGVHFPLDTVGGAFLGIVIVWSIMKASEWRGFIQPQKNKVRRHDT
jgi:undecaprenyl-diphosphatase